MADSTPVIRPTLFLASSRRRWNNQRRHCGLDPHLAMLGTKISAKQRVGILGPVAKQRPGVPGVNDFFNAERFCGAERRTVLCEAVFDFPTVSGRIGRRFDLPPIGGLYTAFDRQGAPIARRPGVAQVEPLRVAVSRAGNSVDAAEENRNPGNFGLVDRYERSCSHAGRTFAFSRTAYQEPGIINEID